MAIYDTMQYIKCDVSTICIGMAASMGAFLLSSGARGKRLALPNAEIMIHQPSAGTQGQITDMAIHLRRLENWMSLSGSWASRYSSWATIREAVVSLTSSDSMTIRSLSRREKMS